jgi:RNA-directed DNA polymerase
MLFEGILKKNLPLMSSRSYAYRTDLSAQNAIWYIKSEFRERHRLYVAEYDFRKYFDMIDHEHIRRILRDRFLLTQVERSAIDAFLSVGASPAADYTAVDGPRRERGIPQGTSVSLFLANVAAWELDRGLEGEGVGFARYADDTLIWSTDYGRLCAAVEVLHEHAALIGATVSGEKSPGIHLLLPNGIEGEIASIHEVDYLGHRMTTAFTRMKPEGEERVRARIRQLIFDSLLREPLAGTQDLARIRPTVDSDYVVLISQLRRFLYGDLSERALRRFQTRGAPLRRFKGVMSAYPLVDDQEALWALDRWILDRIWLAVRKRGRLLQAAGLEELPPPHGVSRDDLRTLSGKSSKTGKKIPLAIPSVRRINDVIADAAAKYGPSQVGQPDVY